MNDLTGNITWPTFGRTSKAYMLTRLLYIADINITRVLRYRLLPASQAHAVPPSDPDFLTQAAPELADIASQAVAVQRNARDEGVPRYLL
jgi:hypothetical protein